MAAPAAMCYSEQTSPQWEAGPMRLVLLCTLGLAVLPAIPSPAPGQGSAQAKPSSPEHSRRGATYRIDVDPRTTSRIDGDKRLVTVQFQVRRNTDGALVTDVR